MKKVFTVFIICIVFLSTGTQIFAEQNEWTSVTDLTKKIDRVNLLAIDGKIYSIGGHDQNKFYDTIDVYDPEAKTWTQKGKLPAVRGTVNAAVYDGKIYIVGGEPINNKLDIYDPLKNEWTQGKSFPNDVAGYAAQFVNGKLLVIGGFTKYTDSSDKVYEYDPSTNIWTEKAHLSTPRRYTTSVLVNGKVYVIGGINESKGMLSSIEVYDPQNNTWTTKSPMSTPRMGLASAVLNNEIYAIGGNTATDTISGPGTAEVEKYNPKTDTWSKVTSMPTARGFLSAISLNNSIYVAGGSNKSVYFSVFEKYTPGDNGTSPSQPGDPGTSPSQPGDPGTSQPNNPVGDRAILVVTMTTGLEKEFDLSMKEVNDFISWYEGKQAGSGSASYAINKHDNNKGPFSSRKDYMLYDRILTFEVSEYSK
ncbi:Kelch repeat-containing protein [Paenibacillus polymyxa]|uniref:Kelch repeat-containing protein n=1 Tax=Paenibacillus TaxID=44249 RepID=UPI00129B0715|nr:MULTISPECIES: kelch repeat-containing protein [Paenibacillus]KAE8558469.1 galactose oxidase [Paenibacillus polymyxa]KAF6650899.1 kelch-like protein [Paenibacillus sp. EKM301P]MCJ1223201.1 kelch-like protein [Paenibacillus polymyxa]UBS87754.1 kelch-like protein [Paenibacillus polymyxa]WHX36343.1 kelch repeat-containing protein [Paenibacillus polymyxa]